MNLLVTAKHAGMRYSSSRLWHYIFFSLFNHRFYVCIGAGLTHRLIFKGQCDPWAQMFVQSWSKGTTEFNRWEMKLWLEATVHGSLVFLQLTAELRCAFCPSHTFMPHPKNIKQCRAVEVQDECITCIRTSKRSEGQSQLKTLEREVPPDAG